MNIGLQVSPFWRWRPEPLLSSRKLLSFAIIISLIALLIHFLFSRSALTPMQLLAIGGSLALANCAVAIAGLRTPQRLAWGFYLIVSGATYVLLGFATPLTAMIWLAPVALDMVSGP